MARALIVGVVVMGLSAPVFAQGKTQQSESASKAKMPDMSKVGPWTRKPTNEANTRKEIQAFLKTEEDLMKKRDFDAMVQRHDFPIFMVTDDSSGTPVAMQYTREKYVAEMKPMFENMPKDVTVTHKPTITVLSDSLASVEDHFTMTMGQQRLTGRSSALLVKRDGQWKWKTMTEAGWGDVAAQGVGGSGSEDAAQPSKRMKR